MDTNFGALPPPENPGKKKLWPLFKWAMLFGSLSLVALVLYCFYLFQDLEGLMAQAPQSHPSIIYSDAFVLKENSIYENALLPERLRELQIAFNETPEQIDWKTKKFDFPPALMPEEPETVPAAGAQVVVKIRDGKIASIEIDGKGVRSVVLEPTPVAQLVGAQLSIRDYLKLEDIPAMLMKSIISIEDQRYLDHIGFDLRSLARALWANIRYRSLAQGGSTLTQQLVKNLLGTRQKTLFRKLRELILAILMEVKYSKDDILEKYLNEVYFGQIGALEVHGVPEAAKYFFNKPIQKLTLAEMALIAGVIRGPAYYSPYKHAERAIERKNTVLRKMAELKVITDTELNQALAQQLYFAPPVTTSNKAPYFVDYVKAQVLDQLKDKISAEDLSNQGLRIFTTIDLPIQKRADQSVKPWVVELETRYKIERPLRLEGLLVAADPKTGFVKALVGGRSYSETTFNRVLNMKRQVGSTFKPIAYFTAFLKGADDKGVPYNESYPVIDEPWTYTYSSGRNQPQKKWSPKNYEKEFRGPIPLREAFINSINIPMAKIATEVGSKKIAETAHKLGIASPLPEIPSLALGSVELNAMELLQAYSTIANRGERVELTTVRAIIDSTGTGLARSVPHQERVYDADQFDLLHQLLRAVVLEGTAKSMAAFGYAKTAYGKTGTTSYSRDAWFAGFSQGLTAVSWVGFDELKVPDDEDETGATKLDPIVANAIKSFKSPAPLTGAGAAMPIWTRFFMSAVPAKIDEDPFVR